MCMQVTAVFHGLVMKFACQLLDFLFQHDLVKIRLCTNMGMAPVLRSLIFVRWINRDRSLHDFGAGKISKKGIPQEVGFGERPETYHLKATQGSSKMTRGCAW